MIEIEKINVKKKSPLQLFYLKNIYKMFAMLTLDH